uniref:DMAP-interaction domain-containing protein n=1 Tax=Angiostrongylus cantonensis TaxID=6313 RepID=A0A158P739_ANGCA
MRTLGHLKLSTHERGPMNFPWGLNPSYGEWSCAGGKADPRVNGYDCGGGKADPQLTSYLECPPRQIGPRDDGDGDQQGAGTAADEAVHRSTPRGGRLFSDKLYVKGDDCISAEIEVQRFGTVVAAGGSGSKHLVECSNRIWLIYLKMFASSDITQKGYEKKRSLIFAKYCKGYSAGPGQSKCSPGTRARRQHHRRLTRDESRFHSEIRAEAVQQALAEYSHGNKVLPGVVQPVKRATEARHLIRASGPSSNGAVSFSAPPDVTGGAAVEAMLRRVQEQHEPKPQIHRETEASPKMTSSSPDVDAGRVPVKPVRGVDQSSIGGDVEQVND